VICNVCAGGMYAASRHAELVSYEVQYFQCRQAHLAAGVSSRVLATIVVGVFFAGETKPAIQGLVRPSAPDQFPRALQPMNAIISSISGQWSGGLMLRSELDTRRGPQS
jgi:tetrahydromethanopterin S-methyltransferase subunit F